MVQADEKKIQAIINTVKGLPVDCKNFETADSWVGIVIELENILDNFTMEDIPVETEVPIHAPEEVITDA